jgi:HEAT repeat protein
LTAQLQVITLYLCLVGSAQFDSSDAKFFFVRVNMHRKPLLIGFLAVAGFALLCALIAFNLRRVSEYDGKTMEQWCLQIYSAPDQKPRDEALKEMKAIGPRAVPDLLPLLQAKDSVIRRRVWWSSMGIPSRAHRVLLKFVKQPNAVLLRGGAARCLAVYGPQAKAAIPALARNLRDGDSGVCWESATTLAAIGKDSLPVLRDALHDKFLLARQTAAFALGQIGPEARAAIPDLIEASNDPEDSVRIQVRGALAKITNDVSQAVSGLNRASPRLLPSPP